jgi:hypothetical protein
MNIRAAAKREAVFLQDITATNALSSPLATPIVPGAVEGSTDVDSLTSDNRTFAGGKKDVVGQPSRKTLPTSLTNRIKETEASRVSVWRVGRAFSWLKQERRLA